MRELACTSAGLTDASATMLAGTSRLAALAELDLRYNAVTVEGERELRGSPSLRRLQRVLT